MKKQLIGFIFGLVALLPSAALAQYTHSGFFDGGTTLTATCTKTSGTIASQDVFLGNAQGNTTVTLPAASIGCVDYDVVDLRYTAAASQSYTLTVNGGTGTNLVILSNGGNLIAAPTGAASGGANILHQIWVYDAVATTPQWELVTQEVLPVLGLPVLGFVSTSAATAFGTAVGSTTLIASAPSGNPAFAVASLGEVSTIGTSCAGGGSNTAQLTVSYTSPNGSSHVATGTTMTFTGNGSLTTDVTNSNPISVESGTAVTYSVASALGSTGCSPAPQYTFHVSANVP